MVLSKVLAPDTLADMRAVEPGRTYTIESQLDGAVLLCQWIFEELPEGGTRLRQRIGVSGPGAQEHAETVRRGFGATLPEGISRIATVLAEAEARHAGSG